VTRSSLFRYGTAIFINACALVITYLSWEIVEFHHASFILLSVIISALYTGLRPTLVSIAFDIVILQYFFTSQAFSEDGPFIQFLRLMVFGTVATLIAGLVATRQSSAHKTQVFVSEQQLDTEEKFRLLVESIEEYAIFMLDHRGVIASWNPGLKRVLGYEEPEIVNKHILVIYTPEDIASGAAAQELKEAETRGQAADERWHVRKDGSRFWASGIVTSLKSRTGELRGFVKVMRDSTERKMAAAEREIILERLASERAKLKAILHEMPIGVVIADAPFGKLTLINGRVQDIFGEGLVRLSQTLDQYDQWEGLHPDGRPYKSQQWPLARSITTGEIVLGEEITIIRAGGTRRTVSVSAAPLYDTKQQIVAGMMTVQDITEKRLGEEALRSAHAELEQRVRERTADLAKANETLRQEARERKAAEEARGYLLQRLDSAQEEERLRISRELHDQMGQHLTALMVSFTLLEDVAADHAEVRRHLQPLKNLLNDVTQDLDSLIHQIRPSALNEFGLEAALANYAEEWSEISKIGVDFQSSGFDKYHLTPAVELTIYRIVQEALTNVLKHAQATRVSLILEELDQHVLVIVEDDGKGFDVEAVMNMPDMERRLGLLGMKERVALVGGSLNIESRVGGGTTVFAKVPITTTGEGDK